jgi:hypothetical protein
MKSTGDDEVETQSAKTQIVERQSVEAQSKAFRGERLKSSQGDRDGVKRSR